MFKRFAAVVAAGVLVATGMAAGPAHATTDPRPRATVPGACAPLSLVNPTWWGAEFRYQVGRHRVMGTVAVPSRSTVRRALRPRYGSGELTVRWWARLHDAQAKVAAVRAAEGVRVAAAAELSKREGDVETAEQALVNFEEEYSRPDVAKENTWEQELERLKDDQRPEAQEKVALLNAYLSAASGARDAKDELQEAEAKLDEVKAAKYWTPWRRGVVRVPECVTSTPAPTPTDEPTATPTPTEEPSEEPTETPSEEPSETPSEEPAKPAPTVTQTITRTVVVNNIPVPSRVDTGFGGLAR